MNSKSLKNKYRLILFAAVMILGVINFKEVIALAAGGFKVIFPLILGGMMAFVLNLPMRQIEKRIFKKNGNQKADKLKRPVSIVLALIFMVAVIVLIIFMVVPQLVETIIELGKKVPQFVDSSILMLEKICADNPQIMEFLAMLNIEDIAIDWDAFLKGAVGFLTSGFGNAMNVTFTLAGDFIHSIVQTGIALVFAIYLLSQKEKLGVQIHTVMKVFLPEKRFALITKCTKLLNKNFSNFIAGQCVEAIILGTLFTVLMTIFGFPYALLIGVLIAFTALIPIVGAFIGCAVGAFLILMESPMEALLFIVMFLILQQIEGNFIYPHVVGNSVGLPSIWIFVSVTLGGSLFGIAGMLTFIPLVSTAYELLREAVHKRRLETGT